MKPLTKWLAFYGLRMFLFYVILVSAFYAFRAFDAFSAIEVLEARTVHAILTPFYPGVSVQGSTLSNIVLDGSYSGLSVQVIDLCVGYFPMAAFAAMITAIPRARKKQVAYSLVIGLPSLFALNIARMASLFFIGAGYGVEAFNLWHLFIVSYDLLFFVVVLFVFCVTVFFGKKFFMDSINSFSDSNTKLI